MKTFAFASTSSGIVTKASNSIRKYAVKNGHTETFLHKADIIVDDYDFEYHKYSNIDIGILISTIKDSWIHLAGQKFIDDSELINVFVQAISTNEAVSNLGTDILFSLNGDKYYDIQKFYALHHVNKKSNGLFLFREITNISNVLTYTESLNLLHYIHNNKIHNKELFVKFANDFLKMFGICSPLKLKVSIDISAPEESHDKL